MHSNRVALITGGSRGIGLGIALALAKTGFTPIVTGRRGGEEAGSALAQICAHAQDAMYVQADVSSAADRERLIEQAESRFGRLDVLVNNAGIAPRLRADVLEATADSFDEVISVNLKGPYFLTQAVARWMIRQQQENSGEHRAIINIGSVSAVYASTNRGDYCLSKAGIAMATKLWAARLAEFGISVYEVRPGLVATDMTRGVKSKYDAMIEGDLLLEKRWGTPADVGAAVSVLARGDLPYATGAVLMLDGGMTVPRL